MQYRYRLPSVVLSVITCPRYVDIFLFSLYCVVVIQIVICVLPLALIGDVQALIKLYPAFLVVE